MTQNRPDVIDLQRHPVSGSSGLTGHCTTSRYTKHDHTLSSTLRWGFALAATLHVTCVTPATAAPLVGFDLHHYTSRHYVVQTTLLQSEASWFAAHMDTVHAEYARRFKGFTPQGSKAMTLYLFRTPNEYMHFMTGMTLPAQNTAGMFFVHKHDRGVATWSRGRSHETTLKVLQHECFHQFAHRYIGRGLPVWVNEGLAQYFEDGILVRGKMVLGLANGRRIAVVQEALTSGRAVAFDDLLSMTADRWKKTVTSGRGEASLLYAQSWAVVYFLVHGHNGSYRRSFDAYLAKISHGRSSLQAFAAAFGTDHTRDFRSRWHDFMENIEPDPLSTALARMSFLGEGLRYLADQGDKLPSNLRELRRRLQKIQFRTIFTQHGFQAITKSTDRSVYQYTLPNGTEDPFQLLPPVLGDLPPRIVAPGLQPEPMLTWSRDADGVLVQAFDYW